MATILRDWSYRYQWLYDGISRLAALSVGGEARFRQLALQYLTIHSDTQVLDLCCGSGQTTQFLVNFSQNVTGLDASPKSLQRARQNVPLASYVEAFAEEMPFANNLFDVVHTSVALHEMQPQQLRKIINEVYRVLKPGGVFTLVDFHAPTNPIFWPGVSLFLLLFETETAWQLLKTDLPRLLTETGFEVGEPTLYAGGSLQVIQAKK
ncbi:class I SAM-dependent methyltransferase [Nostoc sp.]|uniref:class I SAM-dependent methyltransferase n=1 Tax=Nostoc sp. TaxID=1180 RepID=UPI002FF85CE2